MQHNLRKMAAALALIFAWIIVPGGVMGGGIPPGRWWKMPQAAQLGLSDKEKKEVEDLFVQNRRSLIELKSILEKERFELNNLLENDSFDETAAMKQFKKLEKARTNIAHERFRFLLRIRKILGFERYQLLKVKYREYREKRRKK